MDRREFMKSVGTAGLAGIALTGVGQALADAATGTAAMTTQAAALGATGQIPHKLPPLPYDYDALEPYLEEQILKIHHDRHHQGYVNGINATEAQVKEAQKTGDYSNIKALSRNLAFHYSGHVLHSVYWQSMSPNGGGRPDGALGQQINEDFGSYETFREHFLAATNAVEASGWGILAWQPLGRQLVVLQAEKHQNLTQWGCTPLLVLDVWEHAYYLQYRNHRGDFTEGFFDVVAWDNAAAMFAEVTG